MSLKGTRTEKNLMAAFAGESQARNRYTFFASKAKKEGFEQIAAIFEETATQESVHAKQFFGFLEGGDIKVDASFPAGVVGTTSENLKAAAIGERHEWSELYPAFARIAREEGFLEVAKKFEAISVAEKRHERRYLALRANFDAGQIFKKDRTVNWCCRKCGYVHEASEAPAFCPACGHPQSYFEIMSENW